MTASNLTVTDTCIKGYAAFKKEKLPYIIFKIDDKFTKIDVDCTGEKGDTHEAFVTKLKGAGNKGEGRYAVYNCLYNESKASKLVSITWILDEARVKQRMMYASSKKSLFEKLEGLQHDMQCNDYDELKWDCMANLCNSKYD